MGQPETENDHDLCLWDSAEKEFLVGIVGTGPGFLSFLDILHNEQYQEYLPGMRLAALAEAGPGAGKIAFAKTLGVPVYASFEDMLAAHPDLDLVVEMTGSASKVRRLRHTLSPSISMLDHFSTVFLCGLHNMLQVSAHCRVDLDRHKALLQAIIDEIREDIILLDKDGLVQDANRNVVERTGLPKDALIGRPCSEVQTLEDGSRFCCGPDENCPFFSTLETRAKAETLMTRVDAEGRLKYYRVYAYPILNPFGQMTHVMVMRRDITARTYQEKRREQAEKMAVIGEMSMYLAHEIRNPLFAIGGFTKSLLGSENLTEKERQKLQIISAETKRLNEMLNSILAFSRKTEVETGPVDILRTAADAVDIMRIGFSDKGYRFILNADPALPMVRGEEERLKQCLVSLMKNSVEAMPDGGEVVMAIELERDFVVLTVADSGRGMSGKDLEQVFSPFHTSKGRGYGLGLAMIKKIVEESGGAVSVASKEGHGAVVTLRLAPILAGPDGAEGPMEPVGPDGADGSDGPAGNGADDPARRTNA